MGRILLNLRGGIALLIIIVIPLTLTIAATIATYFGPLIGLIFLGGATCFIFVKAKSMMKGSTDSNISSYNQAADDAASTFDNLLTHVDYYNTCFF